MTNRTDIAYQVASEFSQWKGHILSPGSRKADRAATYNAMLERLVLAAVGDFDEAERIASGYSKA